MPKEIIFDKKNILVAGGAGFIGSFLCDELVKDAKVICVDNFSTGSEQNIDHLLSNPDFIFINHDLSKPIDLMAFPELAKFKVEFQGIQEIYNLACPMSPKQFMSNKIATLDANSLVVKNLLEIAVENKAKFLQVSSSVIYGPRRRENSMMQIKESDLGIVDHLSERAVYDEGKRFAETMVANYRDVYGIDAKIVRLFRTYGPRMEMEDDQMIPDFINSALNDSDIEIFGDEGFGSSFCYIDDAIDGLVKMMNSPLAGPINIGSDVNVLFKDVVDLIIKETNSQSKVVYKDSKLFMSELILPDIYKARNELFWMPVVTLENGIKKTVFSLQANQRLKEGF